MTGTVGGFNCVDYLLTRCDIVLPVPNYENTAKNLCPFFTDGCIVAANGRSYLCIQYFCDDLKKEIDMQAASKYLRKLRFVIDNFSIAECML